RQDLMYSEGGMREESREIVRSRRERLWHLRTGCAVDGRRQYFEIGASIAWTARGGVRWDRSNRELFGVQGSGAVLPRTARPCPGSCTRDSAVFAFAIR